MIAYTREVNRELPKLPRLSREADEHWLPRVASSLPESLQIVNFVQLYNDIYDQTSTRSSTNRRPSDFRCSCISGEARSQ